MTPQQKAEELYLKYHNLWINGNSIIAKVCASIAVDELIEIACDYSDYDETVTKEYWEKVKTEIDNL
jgi:hypothetical protein